MDNDLIEYVLWPKLPGAEDFFSVFSLHIGALREKGRELERRNLVAARGKWSREVQRLIQ